MCLFGGEHIQVDTGFLAELFPDLLVEDLGCKSFLSFVRIVDQRLILLDDQATGLQQFRQEPGGLFCLGAKLFRGDAWANNTPSAKPNRMIGNFTRRTMRPPQRRLVGGRFPAGALGIVSRHLLDVEGQPLR